MQHQPPPFARFGELLNSGTPNHVRDEGSFPRKPSPSVGDGCAADHCQPGLLLTTELDPIADAGAGDPGICNGATSGLSQRSNLGLLDHLVGTAEQRRWHGEAERLV